jgi:hypothetical protein
MSKLHETYAKLKEIYKDDPESYERIVKEEARVTEMLRTKEYYKLPTTKALIQLCRRDVITARKTLATERTLMNDPEAMRALWAMVDARLWFLERVSQNYDEELRSIEEELATELSLL